MNNDRISYTSGGGCLMLFGLPFLLGGLAVITVGFLGDLKDESGNPASPFFFIPFGLVFASVGSAFIFGRSGMLIERGARTITSWWGLVFPFSKTVRRWDEFAWVGVTTKIIRSDKSTRTVYPVNLIGDGDVFEVRSLETPRLARREAERVAKLMELGIRDDSSGTMVEREAGTLDESLRDRIRREGRELTLPEQPGVTRSTFRVDGQTATFEIPPAGIGGQHMVAGAVSAVMLIFMLFFFASPALSMFRDDSGGGRVFGLFWVGAGVLMIGGTIAPLLRMFQSASNQDTVVVSPESLSVQRRGKAGTTNLSMPISKLEELEVGARSGGGRAGLMFRTGTVMALSDDEEISFGQGLDADELQWIRDTIEIIIAKA